MDESSLTSIAKTFATALIDAFRRAFQGALFAIWVPSAATFVLVTFSGPYDELVLGKLPVIDILFRSFVGGLGVAGVAATAWTFWRFVVAPTNGRPFSEGFTMAVIVAAVAAIAGYIAAVYARFNPAFEKDAPSMAHLSI
jgi:hypothetical protein